MKITVGNCEILSVLKIILHMLNCAQLTTHPLLQIVQRVSPAASARLSAVHILALEQFQQSSTVQSTPFLSTPFQSTPIHSTPFQSIPIQSFAFLPMAPHSEWVIVSRGEIESGMPMTWHWTTTTTTTLISRCLDDDGLREKRAEISLSEHETHSPSDSESAVSIRSSWCTNSMSVYRKGKYAVIMIVTAMAVPTHSVHNVCVFARDTLSLSLPITMWFAMWIAATGSAGFQRSIRSQNASTFLLCARSCIVLVLRRETDGGLQGLANCKEELQRPVPVLSAWTWPCRTERKVKMQFVKCMQVAPSNLGEHCRISGPWPLQKECCSSSGTAGHRTSNCHPAIHLVFEFHVGAIGPVNVSEMCLTVYLRQCFFASQERVWRFYILRIEMTFIIPNTISRTAVCKRSRSHKIPYT